MISGRKHCAKSFKGPQDRQLNGEREILEDAILFVGVHCGVHIQDGQVRLKTKDYRDFVIAREAIRSRTSKEIVMAK